MTYLGTEASAWFHSLNTCNFLPSYHLQPGGCSGSVSCVRFLTSATCVFHSWMFLSKHGLYLSTRINCIQVEACHINAVNVKLHVQQTEENVWGEGMSKKKRSFFFSSLCWSGCSMCLDKQVLYFTTVKQKHWLILHRLPTIPWE